MGHSDKQNTFKEPTYHVLVYGLVTGVGFRFSAVREAKRYNGLKGYVRNKAPNTVECMVQGPEKEVNDFINWLKNGPPSAEVEDCKVTPVSEYSKLGDFNVAP
mgnify:CR=1 FL=1